MTPRLMSVAFALSLVTSLAACGGDSDGGANTTIAVTTSMAPATTDAATTTSTSSTSTSSTSTTVPILGLDLTSTGLGDALFGASADGVLAYVTSILGDATSDTGWVDPVETGSSCMGNEVRAVTFHDLTLFFSDDSLEATGYRHFASYTYGPPATSVLDPIGLRTKVEGDDSDGVTIGDTVAALLAAHPKATIAPEDEMSGASFFIEEGLSGFITGVGKNDRITSVVGGFGCGE